MLEAVIYDMDGIIINTIPLGKKAEYEIFRKHGITITEEMYKDTMGFRENETIAYWCEKYHWDTLNQEEILKEYISYYKKEVDTNGILMEGVLQSLQFLKSKKVKLALASSSYRKQINTVIQKFALEEYFDVIYSAEHEEYGKPHPGVYLTTAKELQVNPFNCLAIEDSFNGLLAAKSARMQCLYIPLTEIDNKASCLADATIPSLCEFDDKLWYKIHVSA